MYDTFPDRNYFNFCHMISRRLLLVQAAAITAFRPFNTAARVLATPLKLPFKIGACDWSIGKDSDRGAFELVRQIGLEGVMVNIGSVGNNLHLHNKAVQQQFLETAQSTGIRISSIAIGELNNVPYKSDPRGSIYTGHHPA